MPTDHSLLITDFPGLILKRHMATSLNQTTFEFSGGEEKEFLSGRAIPAEASKPKKGRGKKGLQEAEVEESVQIPADDILFSKQYYPIGEVALMFKVNASLLRFWESEFNLELRKNKKGDRFFKPTDIKLIELIHDLVRRRKFTIEGAKEFLKKNSGAGEKYAMIQSLQKLRSFLLELKAHL